MRDRPSPADGSPQTNPSAADPKHVEARAVTHVYGSTRALDDVSLDVSRGEIHALLGPNGAGKTTLLRILGGLLTPTRGTIRITGLDPVAHRRQAQSVIGLVPGGDRTLYLRLSGLENLIFFARLYGVPYTEARHRAQEFLAQVGLLDAARRQVGAYSHGMQKLLSVGRALLTAPAVLLVDEATHDLDPEAARRVRELVRDASRGGAAVLWATQRVDEIRGFADRVSLLHRGTIRFTGTVPQLMAHSAPKRHLLRIRNGQNLDLTAALSATLGGRGTVAAPGPDPEHYLLTLTDGTVLGDALAALAGAGFQVVACREERPEIEEAFLHLTRGTSPP